MKKFGVHNEYSRLQTVIMCPPAHFEIRTPINITQAKWHHLGRGPDAVKRLEQYNAVKSTLEKEGVKVWEISPSEKYSYQVFTRDAGVITDQGAFVGRFKFDPRKGEEKPFMQVLEQNDVGVAHRLKDPAIFEGGDFMLLNQNEAFVGVGDRTNKDALAVLSDRLPSIELHPVHLPKDFLHLDVVLNIISPDIALAYLPAISDDGRSLLKNLHFNIIDVPKEEQETMATNVLAIGNHKIISASCNKTTNENIRKKGFDVIEIEMSEIIKGGGGVRCMTLPVLRA